VAAGSTVTWTNNDNFTHNVQFSAEGLPTEPLTMEPGQAAQLTFTAQGTFAYLCTLHPQDMTGTVVVTP
jgi:plastocyanin